MATKEKAQQNEDLYRGIPKANHKDLGIALPLPPSVNSMYFNTRGGGRTLTRQAKNYIRDSRALINLAIDEQNWYQHEKDVWLYVDLVFYMPDRRVRDSHNMLKLLLDVMQGIVYENDYYAMPRIQSVEYDKHNPRVEILISAQTKRNRNKGVKDVASVV